MDTGSSLHPCRAVWANVESVRMWKSLFAFQNLTAISSPPSTTKDTVLNGYYIPKGRCVFVNQWQVNHDE